MGEGLMRQAPSSYILPNGQSFVQLIDTILEQGNLAFLVAQTVKNLPAMRETWVGKIPWRMAWQPTPVFLPGESYGPRSLAGYSPWGCKELDTTEGLNTFLPSSDMKKPRLLGAGIMVNAIDVCDQMIKLGKPKRKAFDVEGKG